MIAQGHLGKLHTAQVREKAIFTQITKCRICRNASVVPVLDLGEQYLTGVLPSAPNSPLTRGPLQLVRCAGPACCGLVQLRHTYDASEMYGQNYGYRSSLNRTM